MTLRLDPVQLATNSADRDGRLVFQGELLVAVLVRLSDQHGDHAGMWFLEVMFGRSGSQSAPLFASIEEAAKWIEQHLYSRIHFLGGERHVQASSM